jgi:hypothetical protein
MAGNILRADDVWPVVRKLPRVERMRLADKLFQDLKFWTHAELDDIADWAGLKNQGDESLLEPASGKPFTWKKAR